MIYENIFIQFIINILFIILLYNQSIYIYKNKFYLYIKIIKVIKIILYY